MAAMVVLLLLGILQLAVPGLAQSPPSGTVRVESLTYSGSGCPPGSAEGALSPDGIGLTVLFAQFKALTPGSPDDPVKKCQLAVKLIYPTGFTFTVESVASVGGVVFEDAVKGSLEVGYFFPESGTVRTLRELPPPPEGDFHFDDGFSTLIYAPCGSESTSLNVYSEVKVVPPRPPSDNNGGSIDIDNQSFTLRWKPC
ncbi:hypothetical protein CBR_g39707 [Chara braunii]|uniref:DUF4360 domain-containing protein n=1 Tax=Chara braunii TaxID=69332 RepID=A0A388LSA3_CHABU|nr:hypothetical protein CBR_g39707 [Chara braunii]|eukprot:GBG85141.1 hypothetical protein CBR_g39707 [Chara braunii]